ncbi:MAG TPA: glucoamylase family protein [Pseudolabrys sp.]
MKNVFSRFLRTASAPPWADEETIRKELFSVERLEQHGESLAAAQSVSSLPQRGRPLVERVGDNDEALLRAYRVIAAATKDKHPITPAAEWLIDNFHLAEDQIREIRTDLPARYYHQLPKLAEGPFAGYPRIFEVAWAFVAHTDSRFEPEMLQRFVMAYQRVQPLTIGELWALAITLRVVFVENLRRLADLIVGSQAARDAADALADRLLSAVDKSQAMSASALQLYEHAPLTRSFAVQLVQRLRDEDPATTPALLWLDQRLHAQGTNADEIVREELRRQGAANVTIRNIVTSMRIISELDWPEFFESVSLIDEELRTGSAFAAMDFPTRDRYRRAIEELARGSVHSEIEVARAAVVNAKRAEVAQQDGLAEPTPRQRDPGYYLIGQGRRAFEAKLGFRASLKDWLVRANVAAGISGYLAAVAVVAALLLVLALMAAGLAGAAGWLLPALAVLGLFVSIDAAIMLVNRVATHRFGPAALPGLELRDGVPREFRSIVVMPTLLTNSATIDELIERLEIHYLASPDGDIRFALLSDWTDAATENVASDDGLLGAAVERIAELNRVYGPAPDGPRFFLFHRRRSWDEGQGKWIGWERKRGKLHELNRLLRGATDTTFLAVGGELPLAPPGVRYVITLDTDTRLPIGAARRLIGKMAHPLNRPRLDPASRRVVEGYGVLQPRVTPSLPTAQHGSTFQRVFSSPTGVDPYAAAVSDVYQDLFEEGSYSGKGIYDVDAFEAALAGRIAENSVLSHDLLEGIFARAGLVSDIEVFEDFPSRYDVAAARQHRWARGDWQLLPWLVGKAWRFGASGRGDITPLGRWKLADNLRRTMSAPAGVLALVAGWTLLPPEAALMWSGFVLLPFLLTAILPLAARLIPRVSGTTAESHFRAFRQEFSVAALHFGLQVALLAHQAWLMVDAIVRTLSRLYRRRDLLEWTTAAAAAADRELNLLDFYRRMIGAVALTACGAIAVAYAGRDSWLIAAPLLSAWALSPAIAWWVSRAPRPAQSSLPDADADGLRLTARRTWNFFETFVTAEDHMLPPDNFQEDPQPVVAHRTSPTNLGLYLLSILAARDFGWLGLTSAVERLEGTLQTMSRLERFRGHFFNWYDTRDLRPLEPKYISSVDSGNLAGHLIVLRGACRQMLAAPTMGAGAFVGIADAVRLARGALKALSGDRRISGNASARLDVALVALATSLTPPSQSQAELAARLSNLRRQSEALAGLTRALIEEGYEEDHRGITGMADLVTWTEAVVSSIEGHQRDVDHLYPWALFTDDATAGQTTPTLADLPDHCDALIVKLGQQRDGPASDGGADGVAKNDRLIAALQQSAETAKTLVRRIEDIDKAAGEMFDDMQFGFLLDPARQLLSIGYQFAEGALDPSCYDLLASEARLASFIAIAKGDVAPKHWFKLGRAVTPIDRGSALISWSGSMFEYLMPELVMREPAGSLLHQTARLIVSRQIQYGAQCGVPWGISESAYNFRDLELTYQYSNFGVPGLGLKRGLSENIVVAPYATALASMLEPVAAVRNYSRLAEAGGCGRYGWYEALDYTPGRVPEGKSVAVVRAYMAHHQGMSLVAIANTLGGAKMQAHFHADPIVQATELLLQERPPRDVAIKWVRAEEVNQTTQVRELVPPMLRRFRSPHDRIPRSHLLSNGRYAVMITAAGSGYSRWRNLAVSRWREDVTCDPWGSYVYLRDVENGAVWSAGYQPSGAKPDSYAVAFSEDRAEITRRDGTLATILDVVVSPEDDGDVRRVSISNLGARTREIEITSYSEIVLAPASDDASHPAFSKLFVQTEFAPALGALLATRRRRAPNEPEVWAAHLAVVEGETRGELEFETDRARFLGRGNGVQNAASVGSGRPLSNTVGTVLDPIFSIRRCVRIPPGATVRISFWTLLARSRDEVLGLADKHHDAAAFERAATLSWTQAQVQLHHIGITPDEAHLYQRIANRIIYSDPTLRPSPEILKRNDLGPTALWAHDISGDFPIVLCRIDEATHLETVRQLIRAHHYWRMKQLAVDLVIVNERSTSYVQDLQSALESVYRANLPRSPSEKDAAPGSVFLLRADLLSAEVRNLLQTVARAVIVSRRGSLAEQVRRVQEVAPAAEPPRLAPRSPGPPESVAPPQLEYFNGIGGFDQDGREYVTILDGDQATPAPWVNVIANPSFGFQVSAEGSGYTWSVNSRENQLSPRSNDPVSDTPGECIYVRDEDNGDVWTPTALPVRNDASRYIARHGQGYSRFEHVSKEIALDLLQFVPLDDCVKISRLKIKNLSRRRRRLSITAYVEWVLGPSGAACAPYVVTEVDPKTGVMLARNPWRMEFGSRVAFADLLGRQQSWTGDRTEFIGRNGSLALPAALADREPLSNRAGAGLDPCSALQTAIEMPANAEAEIVFLLGEGASAADTLSLVERYRAADLDAVFSDVGKFWDKTLGAVQVRTPDRALDILLNRWLLYQTLVCRIWARSGFYQASGAYGFRDQLQDGMALCISQPGLAREHLLRAAGRQFIEGDVQHWWLPSSGKGIRTRVSDDFLWLSYSAAQYIKATGDLSVLDEQVAFLDGMTLAPDEHDAFFQPMASDQRATLFEHCARGIDRGLSVGSHGLPLIGGGDWNDGLNRVGAGGQGESIWLGWFLCATISNFVAFAERRGDHVRAASWRHHASLLRDALEQEGWDGDWYRRGYFDDGTPLGSASSDECRIDSIAQSWSVISGAADPVRAARAIASVDENLISRGDALALLFTPPFDKTALEPGYIKGYPPGIRENGGQYTHAAIWTVQALAKLGDGDKAAELLSLLNPINHARTFAAAQCYKVEPYVVCADVYSVAPHVGRGGWTWYTGSAGWMYRAGLESILGLYVEGTSLRFDPCVPHAWKEFEIAFRHRSTRYEIRVDNHAGVCRGIARLELDGQALPQGTVQMSLVDDGAIHHVRVTLR